MKACHPNKHGAFTLIELMIVVVVIALLALAAMPDPEANAQQQGQRACETFEADMIYARNLSITQPSDPTVIKVDATNNCYWLARAATPDTPIPHPQTAQSYVVRFGPGGDEGLEQVIIAAYDFDGDDVIGFDTLGGTDQQTPVVLQLESGNAGYQISLSPISMRAMTTKIAKSDLGGIGELDLPIEPGGGGSPEHGGGAGQ